MPNDCGLFNRIRVNAAQPFGQFITWEMVRGFKGVPPYEFYIDVAPTGSDDWTTLNATTPVINDCTYFDPNKYNYATPIDHEYRIRMVDGNAVTFFSNPFKPLGNWNKKDYLLAKEIMRKEYLRLTKFVGIRGVVLKRRQWGPVCPICLDHDTGAVINNKCAICFSTGYVGGYFKAIEMYLDQTNLRRNKETTDLAVKDPFNRKGRSVAYSYLDTKDVWVNTETDERWAISNIEHTAEVRGIPIIYTAEYRKAPTSDIIYEVPLDSTADIVIYLDDTAPNSPVKLDNNDPDPAIPVDAFDW